MRVSFITTVNHNVGDDFVRGGILSLLRDSVGTVEFLDIHKHHPITSRGELAWLHGLGIANGLDRIRGGLGLRVTSLIDRSLPVLSWTDKIARADVLIQSGAPIYWLNEHSNCAENEWWQPLIERRWLGKERGRAFLNLAGGTCQPYHSDGSEFAANGAVLEYIRRFFDLTRLTTVRDALSKRILEIAGREATLLPCTSLWARDLWRLVPEKGDYVVLNYMPQGGHYRFGQTIDADSWRRRFVEMAMRVAKRHEVVLVCHNESEFKCAREMLPGFKRYVSRAWKDYLSIYSRAKWGLVNRVHAGFGLASFGKPVAVVGTDTRARMAEVIGLRHAFVNEATANWLEEQIDFLEGATNQEAERMNALRDEAHRQYRQLLANSLA